MYPHQLHGSRGRLVDADLIEIMSRQSPTRERVLQRMSSASRAAATADQDRDRDRYRRHSVGAADSRLGETVNGVYEQRGRSNGARPERPRSVGRVPPRQDYHHPMNEPSPPRSKSKKRHVMKRRSQSLGGQRRPPTDVGAGAGRGGTAPSGVTTPDASALNLYHVSRPEPRARWVFNLSKRSNVIDNGPPPDVVTSTIDSKRPNLGGLVWLNATLGGHCCLQKGTKSRTVTPVPPDVLDGWLNGQTGFWWIGALKDGHRAMWDSHVVKAWAMVFIPSSPEVAARNNMEVYRDKCLKGSLRVARPGELARKIVDIVSDDQDAEPEAVVHTHLCVLLAEGDDLELKRPRMFPATPGRDRAPKTPKGVKGDEQIIKHSKSLGNMSSNPGGSNTVDLSQVTLDDNGVPQLLSNASGEDADGNAGQGDRSSLQRKNAFLSQSSANAGAIVELQDALQKLDQYRERILILKEDRQAKKALVSQLKDELREKEDMFTAENERLRQERNEIKERAKVLWIDLENLRNQHAESSAGGLTLEEAQGLRAQVDRLRRERNDARSDAMRWLEQQHSALRLPGPSPASATPQSTTGGFGGGLSNGANSRAGGGGVSTAKEVKAAAAIAKLRAKVERLRKERDGAEKQAAVWLTAEKEKLKLEYAAITPVRTASQEDGSGADVVSTEGGRGNAHSPETAMVPTGSASGNGAARSVANGSSGAGAPADTSRGPISIANPSANSSKSSVSADGDDNGTGTGTGTGSGSGSGSGSSSGARKGTGPIVASLKAESLRLKRELDETRMEAKRWRDRASATNSNVNPAASNGVLRAIATRASVGATPPLNGAHTTGNDETEEADVQARKALGQLLGQALNLLAPKDADAEPEAGAGPGLSGADSHGTVSTTTMSSVERNASSDMETIAAGEQTPVATVTEGAGTEQRMLGVASNGTTPTAQLVEVNATLVGGE